MYVQSYVHHLKKMSSYTPLLSSKNRKQYGMSTTVKQTITLRVTAKINDRIFQRSEYFLA